MLIFVFIIKCSLTHSILFIAIAPFVHQSKNENNFQPKFAPNAKICWTTNPTTAKTPTASTNFETILLLYRTDGENFQFFFQIIFSTSCCLNRFDCTDCTDWTAKIDDSCCLNWIEFVKCIGECDEYTAGTTRLYTQFDERWNFNFDTNTRDTLCMICSQCELSTSFASHFHLETIYSVCSKY